MDLYDGYRTTSTYGYRINPLGQHGDEFHKGIDLVKYFKAPIYPFVPGVVTHARMGLTGTGLGGYGNVVAVRDSNGTLHCYCHMDDVNVSVGQLVGLETEIGHLGTTGMSTGPHLHYEVRSKSEPNYGYGSHIDPSNYLKRYYDEGDAEMKDILARLQELEERTKEQEITPAPVWFITEFGDHALDGLVKNPTGDYNFWRLLAIVLRKDKNDLSKLV